MSKITLYENPDFTGKDKDFVHNVPDLNVQNFGNTARSIRVIGQHWVAYACENFTGAFKVLGPGDHASLGDLDQKILSLRLVKEDLKNPEIVLYEDVNFYGLSRSIRETTNDLRRAGFVNLISSHKVKAGVWILFQHANLCGERRITFEGNEWPNYCAFNWNDKLSSVKPLLKSDVEL
ncbi:epidermal differentiation-specific protein-like [Mobula birostris]|uniref:epidermal differentiation-specific protein-like n=1 Tax=Mobula birostris TaxID=1983395 RepID=UPI003B27D247